MIANTSLKKLKDFLILMQLLHDRRGQVPVFPQFPFFFSFFEWLEYLGQYLSGTSDFVKRGHICNRTQNTMLNHGRVHGKTVAGVNSCAFQTLLGHCSRVRRD